MAAYFNTSCSARKGLVRILDLLTEALNERPKLPKYLAIILDDDLIMITQCYTAGASYILGAAIHFLIKKIEILLEQRKCELLDKKPGVVLEDYPKVVWVRMLKRPMDLAVSHLTLGLHGKFNTALEDNLSKASDKHHLISIEVDINDFNQWGKLTASGMKTFWREFDKGMQKFDHGEI